METHHITLPHKPTVPLHISLHLPSPIPPNPTLLIFLNGLLLPRSSWDPTITHLLSSSPATPLPAAILTYDRFGQGTSPRDPSDPPSSPYGHDALSIISDLHSLLTIVSSTFLHTPLPKVTLLFVANSIGCPLARLYISAYSSPNPTSNSPSNPNKAQTLGVLFLDSMMASTNFVSLFPDPDTVPPPELPEGVTLDDIRHAKDRFKVMFHPDVPNKEGFDRRSLRELLPRADGPRLEGVRVLVVVGHDWDVFAEEGEKGSLGVSKAVTNTYVNPAWTRYNEGLTRLVDDAELKIAPGCGHFIQRDGPEFVAAEILRLLERVGK
ncbi:Alpha/Beta hydrolase protein [Podospora aff. communis PSN243]|uniref:Alpha/Beta hydrolase protein n=1 Tax=Podospora aff. communis PSN243 TaxID=3040156 RepID=A0AAV9G553_9PEZI|nr:Alpha/Beta hydrolase protein [Podospora aff. communis PSN243]